MGSCICSPSTDVLVPRMTTAEPPARPLMDTSIACQWEPQPFPAVLETDVDPHQGDRRRARILGVFGIFSITLMVVASMLCIKYDFTTTPEFRTTPSELTRCRAITKSYICYALAGFNSAVLIICLLAYYRRKRDPQFKPRKLIPLQAYLVMSISYILLLSQDGYISVHGKQFPGYPSFILFGGPAFWFPRALVVLPISIMMLQIVLIYYLPHRQWTNTPRWSLHNLDTVAHAYFVMGLIPLFIFYICHTTFMIEDSSHWWFNGLLWLRSAHTTWHLILFGVDGFLAFALILIRKELKRHDLNMTVALTTMSFLWWMTAIFGVGRLYTRMALYMWPHVAYTATMFVQSCILTCVWAWGTLRTPRNRLGTRMFVSAPSTINSGSADLVLVASRASMLTRPGGSRTDPGKGISTLVKGEVAQQEKKGKGTEKLPAETVTLQRSGSV